MSFARTPAVDPLAAIIRTIPDYPKPGIQFRDVTTLLADAAAFRAAVERLCAPYRDAGIDKVAGVEARGFILGGAMAVALGAGFVPIRKKGKLPHATVSVDYELEYGIDSIEMHQDAIAAGERVLVADDLIATGGTADAAVRLLRQLGGGDRRRRLRHRPAGARRRGADRGARRPGAQPRCLRRTLRGTCSEGNAVATFRIRHPGLDPGSIPNR